MGLQICALLSSMHIRLIGAWLLLVFTTFWLRPMYQRLIYDGELNPLFTQTRWLIFSWIFASVGIHWTQNMDKVKGIQNPFPYLLVFLVPIESFINAWCGLHADFWFMLFCSMPLLELAF